MKKKERYRINTDAEGNAIEEKKKEDSCRLLATLDGAIFYKILFFCNILSFKIKNN